MAPSRNSWSFSIHLYWDFSKSWSKIQKVGVNYSKFGVNESSVNIIYRLDLLHNCVSNRQKYSERNVLIRILTVAEPCVTSL